MLEGPGKGSKTKKSFRDVEVLEPANPPKKQKVEEPAQVVLPSQAWPDDEPLGNMLKGGANQNAKPSEPTPDDAAMKLFGDLGIYE